MDNIEVIKGVVDEMQFVIDIQNGILEAHMFPTYEYTWDAEIGAKIPTVYHFVVSCQLDDGLLGHVSAYDRKSVANYISLGMAEELLSPFTQEIANRIEKALNEYADSKNP